jgi:hypothetical protein
MSILSAASDKQDKVQREITAIATGTISHIKTPIYKKEDLSELEEQYNSLADKAASSEKVSDICGAIFAAAGYRDAMYAVKGRKFMRASGLNGKSRAAWGREETLDWMGK